MNNFANKYAPTSFNDLVFHNQQVRDRLKDYAESKRNGSIILHGTYGVGKSTIAKTVIYDRLPSADHRPFVDVFAASDVADHLDGKCERIYGGWNYQRCFRVDTPYSIIDEVDQLTPQKQQKLRAVMDGSVEKHFVLTTNHKHAVDKGILNRCDVIEIEPLTTDDLFVPAKRILSAEGVSVDDQWLRKVLDTVDGSWRDALQAIEDIVLQVNDKAA